MSVLIGTDLGSDVLGFHFYLKRDVKAGEEVAWDYNEFSSTSKETAEQNGTNTLQVPDGETLQVRIQKPQEHPGEPIVLPDGRTNMQMHKDVMNRQAHLEAQFKLQDDHWLANEESECTLEFKKTAHRIKQIEQFRAAQTKLSEFELRRLFGQLPRS